MDTPDDSADVSWWMGLIIAIGCCCFFFWLVAAFLLVSLAKPCGASKESYTPFVSVVTSPLSKDAADASKMTFNEMPVELVDFTDPSFPTCKCSVCGHTYDPDTDSGGRMTPFDKLPAGWTCPATANGPSPLGTTFGPSFPQYVPLVFGAAFTALCCW